MPIAKQKLILLSLVAGVALILFMWFGNPSILSYLIKEDGVIENLSAIFFAAGFIIALISFFNNEHIVAPITWAILCLIFLGEEVSWFQRLFNYSVPLIEQVNAQHEFNFHNLTVFHGGALIGEDVKLNSFFKSQNLFRIGFFGYFLIIPILHINPILAEFFKKKGYIKADSYFTIVLFIVFTLSLLLAVIAPLTVKHALNETREMLYAFFIMLYILFYIQKKEP